MPLPVIVAGAVAGKVMRRSDKYGEDWLFQGEKLSLRQPYALSYKIAEQGLYGVFLHTNKFAGQRNTYRRGDHEY
jgi:hypothetical protein